jgi:hypothetical protein
VTANDFKSGWDAVVRQERAKAQAEGVPEIADDLLLVSAPPGSLDTVSFPAEAAHFLVEAGLPGSCAPFLSFEAVAGGPPSLIQHSGVHQQFRESQVVWTLDSQPAFVSSGGR